MTTTPDLGRRRALRAAAATATAAIAWPAFAAYPDKPIRIVVTFAAGGASDIVARVVGEQLAKKLGQAVIVDNKPGAGGSVGGLNVVQSPADGYTPDALELDADLDRPVRAREAALRPDRRLHPHRLDRLGALRRHGQSGRRASTPSSTSRTRPRRPGGLQFGSGGPASIGHIYGEMMSRALGVKMTHVPYRGGAPMTTDLISGVIPVGIDVITAFVPFFKSGQIKPLAVTSAQRSPLAPDVPTVAESGHAGSCSTTSSASPARQRCRPTSSPASTPRPTRCWRSRRSSSACSSSASPPTPGTPAQFTSFVREQVATPCSRW